MFGTHIFLIVAILSFSINSAAETPLRIGVSAVKPWGYIDKNSEMAGLAVKFAQLLKSELEKTNTFNQIKIEIRPYARLIYELQTGEIDLTVLPIPSVKEQLKGKANLIGNVITVRMMVVSLAGTKEIEDIRTLAGRRVGVVRGAITERELARYNEIPLTKLKTMTQGINLLFNHRVHAVVGSEYAISKSISDLNRDMAEVSVIKYLGSWQNALYISNASKHLDKSAIVSAALIELKKSGKVESLFYVPKHQLLQ